MRQKRLQDMAGRRAAEVCPLRYASCLPEAERVVALGFRYWMIGLGTGDIGAWERAWCLYSGLFGAAGARHAMGRLERWVDAVGASARRDVEVFPECCRSFCRDECIAVSLIAACQHDACAPARSSALVLLATPSIDDVVSQARAFAEAMAMLEYRLAPASILVTASGAQPAGTLLH